ncbi:hypothetical protein ACNOYE_08810 [Nannocystaceae bacterium ST9]
MSPPRVRLRSAGPGLGLAIIAALLGSHRIVPAASLANTLIWGAASPTTARSPR